MKPGTRLGTYEVVEQLGAGGMGEVYRGRDPQLDRDVAIKVLPRDVADDAQSLARLEQEARLLAQLEHPNVATVHGFHEVRPDGADDVVRILVMQLVEGESIAERLAGGALSTDDALEIARQVAAGLGAAHDRGIIHRDLKPANVMVSDGPGGRPTVKVLDFGLAKAQRSERGGSGQDLTASPTLAAQTAAGVIMGTAAYMSPEQARGKPVDRRADVWAFGCLLYEMLTGRQAFAGETLSDIIASILTHEPDWSALPNDLSGSAARALQRCLSRDGEQRPYDVRDVMLEMDAPEPMTSLPGTSSAASTRRGPAWGTIAALVVAGAVGGYGLSRLGAGPDVTAQSEGGMAVPSQHTQLTYRAGAESTPAISADGEWIVYASRADGDWDVYLQAVGGENAINLTPNSADADRMPALSPDGRQIAFRSERAGGGIYIMGRTGESARRLTDTGMNPSWSPDGALLVAASEPISDSPYARQAISELILIDVATGEITPLPTGDAVQPAFSPDGRWVVYWGVAGGDTGQRDLWVVPVEGGEPVRLLDDAATDWTPTFAPDGAAVVFSSDRGGTPSLWQLRLDPVTRAPMGEPVPLMPATSAWLAYPSFAADTGQMTYAAMTTDPQVHRIVVDESMRSVVDGPTPLTSGSRRAYNPDISPDGEWLAFATGLGQQEDLYLQRLDGSVTRRLTNDVFKDRAPRFSPDGTRIAFYAARRGEYEIWQIDVDGSNLRSLTGQEGGGNYANWSPDGSEVAFTTLATQTDVVVLNAVDGTRRVLRPSLSEGRGMTVTGWSPDGGRLVGSTFELTVGASLGVAVIDTEGEVLFELDGPEQAVWLPDGRHLMTYRDEEFGVVDTDTGESWPLLSTSPLRPFEYMSPLRDRPGVLVALRRLEDDVWLASWDSER